MKNKIPINIDLVLIVLFVSSMLAFVNPFDFFMPSTLQMVLLGVVGAVIGAILIFLWQERPQDEREEAHLLMASRVSFFAVAFFLLLALVVQTFQHQLDIWIPISLTVLIVSKMGVVIYLKKKG